MADKYIFQCGETILVALEVEAGDASSVVSISAALAALPPGSTTPRDGQVPDANFTGITFEPATGANPARWILRIEAPVSKTLKAGNYVADARLVLPGGIHITELLNIEMRQAVTQ